MSRHPNPLQRHSSRRPPYRPFFPHRPPSPPRPPKPRKPKGPAEFAPQEPMSRRQWRRMVTAAAYRLARAVKVHGRRIEQMNDRELLGVAARVPERRHNARGKAPPGPQAHPAAGEQARAGARVVAVVANVSVVDAARRCTHRSTA